MSMCTSTKISFSIIAKKSLNELTTKPFWKIYKIPKENVITFKYSLEIQQHHWGLKIEIVSK